MRVSANAPTASSTSMAPPTSNAALLVPPPAPGAGACSVGTATATLGSGVTLGAAVVGATIGVGVGLALATTATVGTGVETSVGATVGAIVRATVGRGVGTGVGGGVAAARTLTVPIIDAPCMPQSYGKVPAFMKRSEPLCPCVSTAVVPMPLTRALCAAASLLVHVTVSPAVIVTLCGSNLNPTMSTARTAAD